jgi:two-component system nitrate/nitrite sensor histidine kinase NarX
MTEKKFPTILSTLNSRIGLLFSIFFILVSISVGATAWAIETQNKDALIINLAGRQRMLIQGMSREVLRINTEDLDADEELLGEYIATFDRTLTGLLNGGQVPYLPGEDVSVPQTRDQTIIAGLRRTMQDWVPFHENLIIMSSALSSDAEISNAAETIERETPLLLKKADEVVRLYEAGSARKITLLRVIQVSFFASVAILLSIGFLIIKKSILNPIRLLASDAERIGGGKLSTPIKPQGLSEMTLLADSLDRMRAQLLDSRVELENRVRRRTQELAALHEVSQEITSRLEIDQVLRSVTGKARELLHCETAFLCLLHETNSALELKAMSGPERALGDVYIQEQDAHIQLVLEDTEAVFCDGNGCDARCKIIAEPYQRSHIASSLRVGGRVIGALCAASPTAEAFTLEDKDLLARLANSAAIALENARLYGEAERVATLEERQRIAADIHDGLAQNLSYMELEVQELVDGLEISEMNSTKSELELLRQSIHQASLEARNSIASLQDDNGFAPKTIEITLNEIIHDFNRLGPPLVQLSSGSLHLLNLQGDQIDHVIRIIKEAILNARRHARAQVVKVSVFSEDGVYEVRVEDDGRGFDPDTLPDDGKTHFGLSIMRSRASRLEGELGVASARGKGSRVTLRWPSQVNDQTSDTALGDGVS